MSACLMVGVAALGLATGAFELSWTHSVEKVEWRERWRVERDALELVEARVRGSGAGMEPGPDAVLRDGWWVWSPGLVVPSLSLAASGATGAGWQLCADGQCRELATQAGDPVTLTPC
ncbi:DUF1850 domain-containing protein [Limimaricola variabilis]|uniref:DUF1850 domain-containing protein n=1 Tax=Limimaricola variabilis TaxID=1492771 RepID=UPI002AC91795|nr:DUF1850 domain-containing protein [Limimaricola variabilis]WPY95163.1 DUF1850 domain-containing protein [Limimaricola variabilis]